MTFTPAPYTRLQATRYLRLNQLRAFNFSSVTADTYICMVLSVPSATNRDINRGKNVLVYAPKNNALCNELA